MQDLLFQEAEYTLYMYETIKKDFEFSYESSKQLIFKQSMYFVSYAYTEVPAYSVGHWWVSTTYSHPTPNT